MSPRVVGDVNFVGGIVEIERARHDLGKRIDRFQWRIVDEHSLGIAGPMDITIVYMRWLFTDTLLCLPADDQKLPLLGELVRTAEPLRIAPSAPINV